MVLALAAFVAMAGSLHDSGDPTGFDSAVASWLYRHFGLIVQQILLALTEPGLTIGALVVVLAGAALARRWDIAVLTAVAPVIALGLMRYVLKPAINRSFGDVVKLSHGQILPGPAFPSGHETALTSVTVLLALLALRSSWTRRTKSISVATAVAWTIAGAAGLVRSAYHYATDTVGGILLALVVTLGTALLVDVLGPRFVSSPDVRSPSRTPPAA